MTETPARDALIRYATTTRTVTVDGLEPLLDAAIAEGAASPAAVPPAVDRATLRDRIRRAICEASGFEFDDDGIEPDEYGDHADAVLSVLPAPADRAAVLEEAAEPPQPEATWQCGDDAYHAAHPWAGQPDWSCSGHHTPAAPAQPAKEA